MRRSAWVAAAVVLLAGCSSEPTTTITAGDLPAAAPPAQGSGAPVEPHEVLADLCDDYCDYLLAAEGNGCPEPDENVSLCADYLDRIRQVAVAVNSRLNQFPGVARMQTDLGDAARSVVDEHTAFLEQECQLIEEARTAEDAACEEQAELIQELATETGELLAEAAGAPGNAAVSG